MVSFDVVSLFTNVPKELVLSGIINSWDTIRDNTNINLDMFLEITEFCLDSSYFMYDSTIYLQKFGTAMGSPLSPIIADIVLNILLDTVRRNLTFEIPILKKFVDDLFLVLPCDKVQQTLEIFNKYSSHLQFTVEQEINGRLPFLDMTVIRHPDGHLTTEWYSKSIASGRILNYLSLHPLRMKINVAYNFAQRVILLSKNCDNQQLRQKIHQQLRMNNFPSSLIGRIFHRLSSQHSQLPETRNNSVQIDQQPQKYISMPYIPRLSEKLSHELHQDYPNMKIASRTNNTVGQFFTKMKDQLDPMLQHNVIYQIPCNSCSGKYIGQTKQFVKKRLSAHKSNQNKLDELLNAGHAYTSPAIKQLADSTTAMVKHCVQTEHRFGTDKAIVIDRTYQHARLNALETFHIKTTENSVNYRADVEAISSAYAGILYTVHANRKKKRIKTNQHDQPPPIPQSINVDLATQ